MGTGRIPDRFGMSTLGDIQNFTGQSPKQPDLVGSAMPLPALNCSMNLWQQLFRVFNELRGGERRQGGAGMEVANGFPSESFWRQQNLKRDCTVRRN